MQINYHRKFVKSYKLRVAPHPSLVKRFINRVGLFKKNRNSPILRDHTLKGDAEGFRSFSITGDCRIIYVEFSDNEVTFYDIGTHNQVY